MAGRCFQLLALLLSVLAALSLGLGVAHFISTYYLLFTPASPYCNSVLSGCKYSEQVVYAFIMPGVWGSAAAFAAGVVAIRAIAKLASWRTIFSTLAFVAAVIFVPAMICISIVNAVKNIITVDSSTPPVFNISTGLPSSTAVLFAVPIAICGLGFIEFILIAGLFIYSCICLRPKPVSSEPEAIPEPAAPKPVKPQTPAVAPAAPEAIYPPTSVNYSPYGPLPYRRPYPITAAQLPDAALYRPGLRTSYQFMPGRYPSAFGAGRPYPQNYVPSYY